MYKFFIRINNNYLNMTNNGYSFHDRIAQGRAFDSIGEAMDAYETFRGKYNNLAEGTAEIVAAGIDEKTIMVMTKISNNR